MGCRRAGDIGGVERGLVLVDCYDNRGFYFTINEKPVV